MIVQSDRDGSAAVSSRRVPAIGFLTESLISLYQSNNWIGASDAATRLGYSLVCFAGGSLSKSSWDEWEPQRNIIYDFVDKNHLQGIILAGSLGNFVSENEFRDFYSRFIDMPLVCLGPEISSVPTVIADNTHGMRELISHLVEDHQCRKIAFVRGPEGNKEAEERLKIFREVLEEHDVAPDPDLIISGDFSRDAGVHAVEYLLEKELRFDALAGANDDTALGALKAFQEHHIRVPDEVLVVGFDDIEESGFSAPPLTTVRQPLAEMGGRAVEVIHNCIEGRKIKGTIIVPASLVTRQSCGCFRRHKDKGNLFDQGNNSAAENREILKVEVEKIINRLAKHAIDTFDSSTAEKISDVFADELAGGGKSESFVSILNKISWQLACAGGDVMGMYHVLIVLRQYAVSIAGGSLSENTESLLQSASEAIADSANRAQANRRLSSERRAMVLRRAGQAIASAFDLEKLLEVIAVELVNLDIDGCYLSLFDKHGKTPVLHLVLAVNEGRRLSVDHEKAKFSAPDIVPDGVLHFSGPLSLLVEPLFFRREQIGIILFDVRRCRDGLTYEILRQHISSALKGALLMKKVQEQTVALENANKQLQKLRDAEHAYLQAIRHELELGREIQNSFLPRDIPEVSGFEVVTAFQPAREVSGDFYDIFLLPDGNLVMVICDVSGKDVSAALYMALIRTLIRALAEQAVSGATRPLDAIGMTNRYLINHHYGNNGRYMYATLFMGLLDPHKSTINYVNAGHNPPVMLTAGGEIRTLVKTTGPAVGIVPDAEFGQKTLNLAPDETLFLYTDGVTEARDPDGAFFSKQKLMSLLTKPARSATELVSAIEQAVKEHSAGNPPFDDVTMLAVRKGI
jgi:serine phosphatase RsbU (regulator of sigma subunit)/DNA-binding LacI/PurR family transcriptional regulator